MGLKATGCYLSRTLSYQGAEFNIARCTLDPIFEEMYDRASKFWQLLHTVCRNLTMGSIGWRMFWGAHTHVAEMIAEHQDTATCSFSGQIGLPGLYKPRPKTQILDPNGARVRDAC